MVGRGVLEGMPFVDDKRGEIRQEFFAFTGVTRLTFASVFTGTSTRTSGISSEPNA